MFFRFSAIAVFSLFLWSCAAHADEFQKAYVPFNPPQALADFTFQDAKGDPVRLANFRGKPVLFNLWATWCGPCVQELPSLDALQGELRGKGLVVIAVDEEHHGNDVAEAFFKRHEINNLALYNDPTGRVASALHVHGIPVTMLINADGLAIGMVEGSIDWSSSATMDFLNGNLLRKASP